MGVHAIRASFATDLRGFPRIKIGSDLLFLRDASKPGGFRNPSAQLKPSPSRSGTKIKKNTLESLKARFWMGHPASLYRTVVELESGRDVAAVGGQGGSSSIHALTLCCASTIWLAFIFCAMSRTPSISCAYA